MMLGLLGAERISELASNDSFLANVDRVIREFDSYMEAERSLVDVSPDSGAFLAAYFSLEFGLTESLPIYSGGLGVLAGDLLKTASDLGLPLVGVGLLYSEGYFRQRLDSDGRQAEVFLKSDFYQMPVQPVLDEDGIQQTVRVDIGGEDVHVKIWSCEVGRVRLILLDTHAQENSEMTREITARLYGGDLDTRIKQEIVLGIAGVRALERIGPSPTVFHINEGHAAFLTLERLRMLMVTRKLSFAEAREVVMSGTVFTTHTPVPAGHDRFERKLVDKSLSVQVEQLGISIKDLMQLGAQDSDNDSGQLDMTALALRLSDYRSGVSKLHGRMSRQMWRTLWPNVPADEVSIDHVTNGVHIRSWVSSDIADLYDRYLGSGWITNPSDPAVWERVSEIPTVELSEARSRKRAHLVAFVRDRVTGHLKSLGASEVALDGVDRILSPDALTIGFARRFASYKRAELIVSDPDRLDRLLNDSERPVQIIFAGKAHPRDDAGKSLIQRIYRLSREPRFQRRLVFLENYDLDAARCLVQGVDLWLNTPLRPQEASGTSGMKAAANGALNVSILDGWWDEAYSPEIGWAIGNGSEIDDPEQRDSRDASAIYDLLENSIVPLFYDASADGGRHGWIERMRESIAAVAPRFNTNRMLTEYYERFYLPAHTRSADLLKDDAARARGLAWWKGHVSHYWKEIRIRSVETAITAELSEGDVFEIRALVETGTISSQDVVAQVYEGLVDALGEIIDPQIVDMERRGIGGDGVLEFVAELRSRGSGRHGYTVRIVPCHSDLPNPMAMGLVRWA